MNVRTALAGLAGGAAMFVWMFIAHMVLPLGEAGVKEIPNEAPVTSAMQGSLAQQSGIYLFPGTGLPENATSDQRNAAMNQYQLKLASSPSGMLIYHPPGASFSFPKLLIVELLTELAVCLIAAWLLSLMWLSKFTSRVAAVTAMGLVAAIATNVSYWNWYGFPGAYTLAYIFTQVMGFVVAGLAIAALTGSKPARRLEAAA